MLGNALVYKVGRPCKAGFLTPVVPIRSLYIPFASRSLLSARTCRILSFSPQTLACFRSAAMFALPFLLSLSASLPFTYAAPMPLFGINFGSGSVADGTPTAVSQSTVDSTLLRPAQFARVAYCSPASVTALSCGAPCEAINQVKVLTAGGDQGATPRCAYGPHLRPMSRLMGSRVFRVCVQTLWPPIRRRRA